MTLKKVLTTLSCLALTLGVYAQIEKQEVSNIDKMTLAIKSNISSFKKIEETNTVVPNKISDYKEIYLKDKVVQIITLNNFNLDKSTARVEYYYNEGKLIYVEQIKSDYKRGGEILKNFM